MFSIAPLLLILPFVGFLINGFFGKRIQHSDHDKGELISGWIAASMSLATFVVTIILWFALRADHAGAVITMFDWISIPSQGFSVPWALQIDTLSVTMLLIITGVGSLIHIYAIGYMHGDENFSRFFTYLNLFLFFMILLVTGSSYLVLFVGWEGVGLCSFLLIGFWFAKDRIVEDPDRGVKMYEGFVNASAARKAMIANRVGDFFMILAMSLIFWSFGSMEYLTVFDHALDMFEHHEDVTLIGTNITVGFGTMITAITALLMLAAAGKSAQIPLFVWLPDAMAGPTPVSALMHAATMVTSGIYLLVRSNVLLELAREAAPLGFFGLMSTPDFIALTGAITAVFAGLIAFTQFDIKKVLAYSTVSQLGFMIAAVGMGAYVPAMFHLATHAFFKALLFMGAGSVIHGMEHGHHHMHDHHHAPDDHADDHHAHHPGEDAHDDFDPQDMRYMGGLIKKMPITGWTYVIGALALAGIFPFAGFWSKDEILAHAAKNGAYAGTTNAWVFTTVNYLLIFAAFCTAFYMGRQLKMVFFGKPRHEVYEHVPESNHHMTRPLIVLAVLSMIGGFVLNLPYFSVEAAEAANSYHFPGIHGESHGSEADSHGDEADSHGEETDAHGEEAADSHGEEADSHAADDGHGEAVAHASTGPELRLEHWLEYSIESFHLSEEGTIKHFPVTPTVLQQDVAITSTVLAVAALVIAFLVVYSFLTKDNLDAQTVDEKDMLPKALGFMRILPLNSLYVKILMPLFNRSADFFAHTIDWLFYHDIVHDQLLRAPYIAFSNFLSNVFDRKVIDGGMVLGSGRLITLFSKLFKEMQTGYVRNYALSLFVGVVALVAYFIVSSLP